MFGDVNDPASAVSRRKAEHRDYALLGELNTRPRTTYLAEVKNPNPELPARRPEASTMAEHPEHPPSPENPPLPRDVTSAMRGEQPTVHVPHPEMHALLAPGHDFATVTEKISSLVLQKGRRSGGSRGSRSPSR